MAGVYEAVAMSARATPPAMVDAVLDRLYAARGVWDRAAEMPGLAALVAPDTLSGLDRATEALADAITKGERILVIGDYDAAI